MRQLCRSVGINIIAISFFFVAGRCGGSYAEVFLPQIDTVAISRADEEVCAADYATRKDFFANVPDAASEQTRHRVAQSGLLGAVSGPEKDAIQSNPTIGQHFAGEQREYTMEFLWFKNAASCTVTFHTTGKQGIYEATIAGQTHGVIGAFTRFRRDILSAKMEEVDNGKRFRPIEFREDVIVGNKRRKKTTHFDYEHDRITIIRERKGKSTEKTLPLPPGETYYDPITASYNFRFGSFGPVERGRTYVVKTVPEKELTEIRVTIATLEEENKKKRPDALRGENAFFIYLQLDKDIIRSASGKIEGWLSETMIPLEGRIRDVVLFGDITGRLHEGGAMLPAP